MINRFIIQNFINVLNRGDGDWRFVLTSHVRNDSKSHKLGDAFDIAPRNGEGYDRKINNVLPNYNLYTQFIQSMKRKIPLLKQIFPLFETFIIEDDHVHITFNSNKVPSKYVEFGIYANPKNPNYGEGVYPNNRIYSTVFIDKDGNISERLI